MVRSIRWRLQAWHMLVLVLVLTSFGSTLYFQLRRARFDEIDAELEGAAQVLVSRLRGPRREPPPFGPGETPPGNRPPRWGGGPPPLLPGGRSPPERMIENLVLPESFINRCDPAEPPYFAVWRSDGLLLKSVPANLDRRLPAAGNAGQERALKLQQQGGNREALLGGPFGITVLVGRPIQRELNELDRLLALLLVTGVTVLGVGLVGDFLISKRVIRPLAKMSATAASISVSNLSQRIDTAGTDSELGSLAQTLNHMFARLERAFQQQLRFTADASHELRTPLAVLSSNAEWALMQERTPEEYRESLELCLKTARHMRSLVEHLLTLARYDAGAVELHRERFPLDQTVEECIEALEPLAADRQLHWERDLAAIEMTGDPARIAQVITNLLSNAIKYNREGGTVQVTLRGEGNRAVLAIRDSGGGIPADDRALIFERFYRTDKARSREAGGSGLGLAICKSIVEAHGGTIWVESELGQGSTFFVSLPCSPPVPAAPTSTRSATAITH